MFLKLYHKELIDSLMYTGAMQKKKKETKQTHIQPMS